MTVTSAPTKKHLFGGSAGAWGAISPGLSPCGAGSMAGLYTQGYSGRSVATLSTPISGGVINLGATCGSFGQVETLTVVLVPAISGTRAPTLAVSTSAPTPHSSGSLAPTTTSMTPPPTTPPQNATVATFCVDFIASCGVTHGWSDVRSCRGSIGRFITGQPEASSGDTLACRIHHLSLAMAATPGSAAVSTHCQHASPSGGGVCVGVPSPLDFCSDYVRNCPTDPRWTSVGACVAESRGYITGDFPTRVSGNTLGCRVYHLGVAQWVFEPNTSGRDRHCAHASHDRADSSGARPCAGVPATVPEFCASVVATCGGLTGWRNVSACEVDARGYIRGSMPMRTGTNAGSTAPRTDTLECRIAQLVSARTATDSQVINTHCLNAGSVNTTLWCTRPASAPDFCAAFSQACSGVPGVVTNWTVRTTCELGYAAIREGSSSESTGDTQRCRHTALTAALAVASTQRAAHCNAASASGGGVCVDPPTTSPSPSPTDTPSRSSTVPPTHSVPTTLTPTSLSPTTAVPTPSTGIPTLAPTVAPRGESTRPPTVRPTELPTRHPSSFPTLLPSTSPSEAPTVAPTDAPTIEMGGTDLATQGTGGDVGHRLPVIIAIVVLAVATVGVILGCRRRQNSHGSDETAGQRADATQASCTTANPTYTPGAQSSDVYVASSVMNGGEDADQGSGQKSSDQSVAVLQDDFESYDI